MWFRSMVFALSAVLLAACSNERGSAPPAAPKDDLVIRRRSTGSQIPAPAETTLYWSSGKRVTDDVRRRIVYDLASKTATIIEKERQAYFVMTFDQVLDQRQKLNQRFEGLPLEDRQKAGFDKEMTLTPTGKTEKIAGYDAREHLIEGGPVTGSVWLADGIRLPPEWQGHERIVANVENTGYALRRLGEAIAALGGYPVRLAMTLTITRQQINVLSEVVEVSTGATPAELLVPPANFRKAELPPA